jgi:putative inorganic carbon (HCO3(-)) transporter
VRLDWLNNYIPKKWVGHIVFYLFSFAFIWLNAWLMVKKDTILGCLIPFALAVILTAILSYDKLIWLVIAIAPLSIPLKEIVYGLPFDMFIPTEPLMFGILLLFVLSPISIVIYIYLGWMAFTSITSSLPLVSFKFWLSRMWYVVIFFFLLSYLFKQQKNIEKFIWLFFVPFVPVVFYTLTRHYLVGFSDDKAAHWVMGPFFNDHTSYGAVLAMLIPFLFAFSFSTWLTKRQRFWASVVLIIVLIAEVMSFSRAAWLSLIISFGVWCIVKLRIKFSTLIITVGSLLIFILLFQETIVQKLERNSTDSSNNLMDHITSAYNISTDASNLERINRWQCAIAMFTEKPILGWGPGTYAMKYAPYQLTSQRTIISTNSGDGGNAHSEYLGALSESGILGMLSFILIIIFVIYTALNSYHKTKDKRIRTLLLASVLSLISYYAHGFLNYFLDFDKAAIPFWGFTAIIVTLSIYVKKQDQENLKIQLDE